MYDVIIVGTGPSGLSAALNIKTYNKDYIWFGSSNLSQKVTKAEKIANYPGLPMITGGELRDKFKEQIELMGLTITERTVTNIVKAKDYFMVIADNDMYEARTIILSVGVMSARVLDREEEFLGRGISYCATCDGMFYKGKNIAVISNDPKYEHEVEYLAGISDSVTFFPQYKGYEVKGDNISISMDTPISVDGDMKVNKLNLRSGKTLDIDGVFCLRNAIVPSTLVPGLETKDGHIIVNRNMETNLKGLYAAGDCTGRPYQYTKAVGEGNVASHSVIEYLSEFK